MATGKFLLMLALAPIGIGSASAQPEAAINLVCFGVGEKITSAYKTDLVWDKYDHRYRSRDGITTGMKQMDTAVTVQIDNGDGRIRLPKVLVPPIASGGDDQHWWQLNDI